MEVASFCTETCFYSYRLSKGHEERNRKTHSIFFPKMLVESLWTKNNKNVASLPIGSFPTSNLTHVPLSVSPRQLSIRTSIQVHGLHVTTLYINILYMSYKKYQTVICFVLSPTFLVDKYSLLRPLRALDPSMA